MPEHFTPSGDESVELVVRVTRSGALQVTGPIENKEWALAVLENAKDAIRNYHGGKALVVPSKDVSLAKL